MPFPLAGWLGIYLNGFERNAVGTCCCMVLWVQHTFPNLLHNGVPAGPEATPALFSTLLTFPSLYSGSGGAATASCTVNARCTVRALQIAH